MSRLQKPDSVEFLKIATYNKIMPLHKNQHIRKSIIKDQVSPSAFEKLNLIYCCEQCTYFESKKLSCNLGFQCSPHLQKNQLKTYNIQGRMSFCRFLEID